MHPDDYMHLSIVQAMAHGHKRESLARLPVTEMCRKYFELHVPATTRAWCLAQQGFVLANSTQRAFDTHTQFTRLHAR
jgi:hypothetical protein